MRFVGALPLLLAASAWASPSAEDFFAQLGIDNIPARDGARVTQTIEKVVNGKTIKLNYDVEHHPDLVQLDILEALTSIQCHDDKLYLNFASSESAAAALERFVDGAVVGGSRSWGCLKEDGSPVSILRKVHSSVLYGENTLYLGTTPASFEHAFRNAQISFSTAVFPENYFKTVHMAPKFEQTEDQVSRRNIDEVDEEEEQEYQMVSNPVLNFFKKALSKITEATKRAIKSLAAIFKAVSALKDGNGVIDHTFYHDIFNWNYNHKTDSASDPITPDPSLPWFVCENCFANADLEIEFVLDISNYKVNRLRLTAGGVTRFNAFTSAYFPGTFTKEWVVRIAEVQAPPIVFEVGGVPFVIDLIVPIDLEFDLMADISGRVTASAHAGGYIRFGLDYRGNWDEAWIVEDGLSYGATEPTLELSQPPTVGLSVALFPNLHVKLDHIGGIAFGIRVIGTTALQLGCADSQLVAQDSDSLAPSSINALMSVDVGAQALLGAFIDIRVLKKSVLKLETTPLQVIAYDRRVYTHCLSI